MIRKLLLSLLIFLNYTVSIAQSELDTIAQHLQTANFNALQTIWAPEVEVSIVSFANQEQMNPMAANQVVKNFYNKKSIVGFEKSAERKLGNTLYLTGKLIATQQNYNLTLLIQLTKEGLKIVSVRIS